MMTVPEALENYRRMNGLTMVLMANKLGLWNSHYNEIIKGKRVLHIGATRKAFALGIPAEILLQPIDK
jgi:transcriptional regulator with XRE-family HTH domain